MNFELEDYGNLLDIQWHETAYKFLMSDADIRVIICGNQGGKTLTAMADAVMRILGIHPNEKRNNIDLPIRFVSKCLPKNDEDEENQQYVEFKRRFPSSMIKQDVTARSKIMIVKNALGLSHKAEFMAKTQELDAFMSVQRAAYYQDEEIEKIKWDENQMRMFHAASKGKGGDTVLTMTPVRGLDWTYDEIWNKASKIYRSKSICDAYGFPEVEERGNDSRIEVFCWATDDNPIFTEEAVERIFEGVDDPDEMAMRRYGVFRQVSGRIYKSFDPKVHVISEDKHYNPSEFRDYWHYRMIDFHPAKPWNITWVAVSPKNEWFVWNEFEARHDSQVTVDIRDKIKEMSLLSEGDEFNRSTLIDPLAKMKQANTGYSVFDDLTMGELGLRRCTHADTKNKQGRMNIKMRLNNSLRCGVPNNNLNPDGAYDARYGEYLPTIWFMDNCRGHKEHFMNFRYIDPKLESVKSTKVVKRESEKWSDYCRNLEFLGSLNPIWYRMQHQDKYEPARWFHGREMRVI